jgi:hypothetical protein
MVAQTRATYNNTQNTGTIHVMTSDDIKAHTFIFPHDPLTHIAGEPNHASIALLKKQVYANARSNSTTLGGGRLGYLGLFTTATVYADLQTKSGHTVEPFVIPNVPNAATTDAERIANRSPLQHRANCHAMEALIQKQVLNAIDEKYIYTLSDDDFGFGGVNSITIIQHLITTYDIITPGDIYANNETLQSNFDCTQPITDLWQRTHECQKFAIAAEIPISDAYVKVVLLKVLQETGQFERFLTPWNLSPASATATLAEFKAHFTKCDNERKLSTAKEAGYHSANNANTKPTATPNATYCTNDPTCFVCNGKNIYYCHSHGGSINPEHTSAKCTNPKTNHIAHATWENLCGGCTSMNWSSKNKPPRNRNNNNG